MVPLFLLSSFIFNILNQFQSFFNDEVTQIHTNPHKKNLYSQFRIYFFILLNIGPLEILQLLSKPLLLLHLQRWKKL